MKIGDIERFLQPDVDWVNWDLTRDSLLWGDKNKDVKKICVTWVATESAIEKAINNNVDLIVSHENPFYAESTHLPYAIKVKRSEKIKLLSENDIAVYRCHDLWDLFPKIGVRDSWVSSLPFKFYTIEGEKLLMYSDVDVKEACDIANILKEKMKPLKENGIEVIGRLDKKVKKIGVGTGAVSNVPELIKNKADLIIVSDDSVNNFTDIQLAIDNDITLIEVAHSTSEIEGIHNLQRYLKNNFQNLDVYFELPTYEITHYF